MKLSEALDKLIFNPLDEELLDDILTALKANLTVGTGFFELHDFLQSVREGAVPYDEFHIRLKPLLRFPFNEFEWRGAVLYPAQATHDDPSTDVMGIFLDETRDQMQALISGVAGLNERNAASVDWNLLFRYVHTMKGSGASVGLHRLANVLHRLEEFLSAQRTTPGMTRTQCELLQATFQLLQLSLSLFRKEKFDDVPYDLFAVVIQSLSLAAPLNGIWQAKLLNALSAESWEADDSLRIPAVHLDRLCSSCESLFALGSRLESSLAAWQGHEILPTLQTFLLEFRTQVDRIQKELIAFRAVPFRQVFPRLERTVLDVERVSGKKITLACFGGEVKVKKSLLERVAEILIHLVRNCADHGVEGESLRLARGKPRAGKITVKAFQQRASYVVQVMDDGGGFDSEKVLARAVSMGLISEKEAQEISYEKALDLVFAPGLSTADTITNISGRGVGMDAVRNLVGELGGTLKLQSLPGMGSSFTISFAADSYVQDVIVVRAGSQQYGLPVDEVASVFALEPADKQGILSTKFIETPQGPIPLLNLSELLGMEDDSASCEAIVFLIGHEGDETEGPAPSVGLTVKSASGVVPVVAKSLPPSLRSLSFISATFVGLDGNPCAIVHPSDLVLKETAFSSRTWLGAAD